MRLTCRLRSIESDEGSRVEEEAISSVTLGGEAACGGGYGWWRRRYEMAASRVSCAEIGSAEIGSAEIGSAEIGSAEMERWRSSERCRLSESAPSLGELTVDWCLDWCLD